VQRSRRQVSIKVGARPRTDVHKVRPRLVLLGVVDYSSPWLGELLPAARVRDSRYDAHHIGVEHLRFARGVPVGVLPGLGGASPSLLRDTAALAMAGGSPTVDVLLARIDGGRPQDLCDPRAVELLTGALAEAQGAMVLFPDALPSPRGITPESPVGDALVQVARTYGPTLSTHFQLGLVDLPSFEEPELFRTLKGLHHHDLVAVCWTGSKREIDRHGWRSGAAWFAGQAVCRKQPMDSIAGLSAALPGGRAVPQGRARWLGAEEPARTLPEFAENAVAELMLARGRVTIRNQPTLRAPVGLWDLPLIRTAKVLHQRIAITANLFVFRQANEETAIILQTALNLALQEFVRRDIVGGPGDSDTPQVHAIPDKNPAQPALIATVRAFLKPWLRELRIDLAVRPGEAAIVEVI